MKTAIFISMMALWVLRGCSRQEAVSQMPWHLLISNDRPSTFVHWNGDVSVKLMGAYSHDDSLKMVRSMAIFNEICPTVKLSMSDKERGDIEIVFVENMSEMGTNHTLSNTKNNPFISTHSWGDNDKMSNCVLTLNKAVIPDSIRQNSLTHLMAFALCPHYVDFFGAEMWDTVSVYNYSSQRQVLTDNSDLRDLDRQILQTIYAPDFERLLPVAQKQYGWKFYWVRENATLLMIFPLVIGLILLAGLFILIYRKWGVKINNHLLRFNAVSFVALVMFGIMLYLYAWLTFMVESSSFQLYQIKVLRVSILVSLMVGLPALNLIRMIELAISRKTHHKYFRSMMLFLSTCLIPSIALCTFTFALNSKQLDRDGVRFLIVSFLVFVVIGIIRALISFFILKEKEIKIENDLQLSRLRELKTKAELNALHSKINPHFLYNSLNSIAGLAKTDADKTEQMALLLSKLFRYSINKEQSDWSTLAEEMEMVQIYLEIEKVRFDERLMFAIDLPDNLKSVRVPRFMIQPLVENAIKHGISKLVEQGHVAVIIRQNERWLEIAVSDNGPDFPAELFPGFGLQGVYDKLEILYPNRFELHFTHAPKKQIMIKLLDDDQL